LDDIIDKIKKLKEKKSHGSSPLDDFFEEEKVQENEEEISKKEKSDLDIKPLGRTSSDKADTPTKQIIPTGENATATTNVDLPSRGIREVTFDEMEESEESVDADKVSAAPDNSIEIKTQDPAKVKHIKLIVALLDAEQYEAARSEVDKLIGE
jgi:hypothetical protein